MLSTQLMERPHPEKHGIEVHMFVEALPDGENGTME
jgi:hypothetical protein